MRVLVTSIACPPKNDPESLQTGKYIKYLSRIHDIDIITSSSPTLWMTTDNSLEPLIENSKQIIKLPIWEPKYISILLNKYFRRFLRPDSRCSFHRKHKKAISLLKNKPDIIYSRSYPISSTIMAKKLKGYFKVPWVLHLSDPWVWSPLFDYHQSNYHKKEELRCITLADAVCFTSLRTIDLYKKKYPEFIDKFHYFPNTYDPESIDSIENYSFNLDKEKINIVYTGSLTGSRSLEYIINACQKMNEINHPLLNKVQIISAGPVDSYNANIIEQNSYLIKYLGILSHKKTQSLQKQADILLTIDFNFDSEEKSIYFPSKIVDYFLAKKPILAITSENSETSLVLQRYNHTALSHKDYDGMIKFIEDFNDNKVPKVFDIPERYSASVNANLLNDLLLKICEK